MAEENTETEGAEATEAFPEYGFHAYTSLFPRLDKKSFAKLKDDIEATGGNHTPIMIYQNEVIDGRERYDACKALNIYPNTAELEEPEDGTGVDLMAYVISANLHRRHLTTSQRAIIAGRISTGKLGDNQHTEETVTVDDAATLLNIGKKSVERGRKVLDDCPPDIITAVETGKIKVSAAEKLSKYEPEEQTKYLAGKASDLKKAIQTPDDQVDWSKRCDDLTKGLLKSLGKMNLETRKAAISDIRKRLSELDKPAIVKKAA